VKSSKCLLNVMKVLLSFMAYMGHQSGRIHACGVARGNEKGRVEDLIKYIRLNFWLGRRFTDFIDLNEQLVTSRNDLANQRVLHTPRRLVRI
jgi:transposase